MPLFHSFKLDKNKSVYIWEIKESLMDLKKNISLSSNDKKKLLSIKSLEHKKGFLASRNLFSSAKIDKLGFNYSSDGAPILNNEKHISITHCKNYAGIAIGENNLGIDLEVYREKIISIAPKFINDKEKFIYNFQSPVEGLTLIWTAKEAIYKAVSVRGINFRDHIIISPFRDGDKNGSAKVFLNKKEIKFSLNFMINKNFCGTIAYIN